MNRLWSSGGSAAMVGATPINCPYQASWGDGIIMRARVLRLLGAGILVAGGLVAPGTVFGAHGGRVYAASSGCGLPPPATPGSDYTATMVVAGVTRTYLVHVPADYQANT